MRWWKMPVLALVVVGACGEKKLPPPKTDFEAFERRYVAEYDALAEGMRKSGREVEGKDVPKDYRAIYVGASGVWIDRKNVATLADIESKKAELVAAIDANATLMPTIGFVGLSVTFDLDAEPAQAAMSVLQLFVGRQAFFNRTVVDADVPQRASQMLCAKPTLVGTPPVGEETVRLSVLLDKERTWVGLSRVNEFQDIPDMAGERDYQKIETTLKEHKASAFFADRTDIEIAAVDGKARDVIGVFDLACKVGFIEMALLPRDKISANPSL